MYLILARPARLALAGGPRSDIRAEGQEQGSLLGDCSTHGTAQHLGFLFLFLAGRPRRRIAHARRCRAQKGKAASDEILPAVPACLRMSVCLYVCMSACLYVWMHVCINVRM